MEPAVCRATAEVSRLCLCSTVEEIQVAAFDPSAGVTVPEIEPCHSQKVDRAMEIWAQRQAGYVKVCVRLCLSSITEEIQVAAFDPSAGVTVPDIEPCHSQKVDRAMEIWAQRQAGYVKVCVRLCLSSITEEIQVAAFDPSAGVTVPDIEPCHSQKVDRAMEIWAQRQAGYVKVCVRLCLSSITEEIQVAAFDPSAGVTVPEIEPCHSQKVDRAMEIWAQRQAGYVKVCVRLCLSSITEEIQVAAFDPSAGVTVPDIEPCHSQKVDRAMEIWAQRQAGYVKVCVRLCLSSITEEIQVAAFDPSAGVTVPDIEPCHSQKVDRAMEIWAQRQAGYVKV